MRAKQAEIAQKYLKKGSLIYLEGRIQTRQWDDKEGQKRSTTEIVATTFRMLGGRGDGSSAPSAGHGDSEMGSISSPEEMPSGEVSDDIPF